jgi:hypothetical protein
MVAMEAVEDVVERDMVVEMGVEEGLTNRVVAIILIITTVQSPITTTNLKNGRLSPVNSNDKFEQNAMTVTNNEEYKLFNAIHDLVSCLRSNQSLIICLLQWNIIPFLQNEILELSCCVDILIITI